MSLNVHVFWIKVLDVTERGKVRKKQLGRQDVN